MHNSREEAIIMEVINFRVRGEIHKFIKFGVTRKSPSLKNYRKDMGIKKEQTR